MFDRSRILASAKRAAPAPQAYAAPAEGRPQAAKRRESRIALWLFIGLVLIYNANGREIGTYDSQPTKFTIRELAVAGTLTLDRLVAEQPAFAERAGFAVDRQGHYRSAYSMVPVLIAAGPAMALQTTGLVDFDAPLAPSLAAAVTASAMTTAGVTLVFLSLSRIVRPATALWTAIGLGLGTGYWTLVSQTLWQHESVAFGSALALWAWLRPGSTLTTPRLMTGAVGFGIAGAARPQVAPLILLMVCWLVARIGWRRTIWPAAVLAGIGMAAIAVNLNWFGDPLGGLPRLQEGHPDIHLMPGSFSTTPWIGAAGLLFSPSRGLLVFSPIVVTAVIGLASRAGDRDYRLGWLAAAAGVQFVAYSLFSVWWAGHTYGPRYLLDLLVLLTPFAALGVERAWRTAWSKALLVVMLAWSIAVAGAGAFVYPHEGWNSTPTEIDRDHARLWDVGDSQILRAFTSAPSPQNFQLLTRAALRRP
jgi:MFS family permease